MAKFDFQKRPRQSSVSIPFEEDEYKELFLIAKSQKVSLRQVVRTMALAGLEEWQKEQVAKFKKVNI